LENFGFQVDVQENKPAINISGFKPEQLFTWKI
jgi:hypothetical protein